MGKQVSSAEERVNNSFPAEVLGRDGNFNLDSFGKLAMDAKLPAADSLVRVGRKRSGMPDITKLERELDQVWQDILRPKAQGRIAVHHQSGSILHANSAYSGAVPGIAKDAQSVSVAFFSEYNNFDRPITDGSRELRVAQFLQGFEPLGEATLGKKSYVTPETRKMANPNYSNRCLIPLDDIFADAKIEYNQWKLQQKKFQQEAWGCQAIVPERSEIEQQKMEVKECKDKIRTELTVRLHQQQVPKKSLGRQFHVGELMKKLDAQKKKMEGGKTNWSDLALDIASVLASAISIAMPFFCPALAPVWLTVIQIAFAIAPCLLCKILPTMWNWVKDFLKKLWQKIKSSKS